MRIVSLLPAGSEIVYALGLGELLVGRSHGCDYPEDVVALPAVTAPGPAGTGVLDRDRLAALQPDLVIADGRVDAGETGDQAVRTALRGHGSEASVVSLDPRSLEGSFNAIVSVGAFVEAEDEAIGLVELLRERLGGLENLVLERRLLGIASRRVIVLASLSPLAGAGAWVPELVRRAGGWDLLGQEQADLEPTSWERLRDLDPEVLVLALDDPAPASADAFARAARSGVLPDWFDELSAVRDGELVAVSSALILRPGPRLVEGLAMLAELFDPEGFAGVGPYGAWVPLSPVGIAPGSGRRPWS
jgi:iron complex transport system substrate-binding protein